MYRLIIYNIINECYWFVVYIDRIGNQIFGKQMIKYNYSFFSFFSSDFGFSHCLGKSII